MGNGSVSLYAGPTTRLWNRAEAIQEEPPPEPLPKKEHTVTRFIATLLAVAALVLAVLPVAIPARADNSSFSAVIEGINNTSTTTATLQTISSVSASDITLVDASTLDGANTTSLYNAIYHNADDVLAMRHVLGGIPVFPPSPCITDVCFGSSMEQFLAAQGILLNQVVTVWVTWPPGPTHPSLLIYYFPPSPCVQFPPSPCRLKTVST